MELEGDMAERSKVGWSGGKRDRGLGGVLTLINFLVRRTESKP